ncbi:O-methyltransferase involved in polyketide biosynthesis [Synechococcus sp. PCC 7502]|uniref:class I SAM-dependent methyltransferase n=1 Tax=Synechococcus sp. PCC 7502 TaxID=1173263 RepID=UPI00029F93F3|nr:class I SAM-dependent methyltransferase [Synechococcus sp. PCC 7502]AFY72533.1 O-methyltransferase involved in polyketide biosynthesis [Synechococcus sp. PCC 7502]
MQQLSQNEFDKISPTALLVAYARTFTDIHYTKQLSEAVNSQSVVEGLLGQKLEEVAEITVLIESRYRSIDRAIAILKSKKTSKNNSGQILEIASGLLPRGMIMSEDTSLRFVETDLPLMIEQKANLVKVLVGDRLNLHFKPVDITALSNHLKDCIELLDRNQPVIILSEGLLMYLTHAQKQQAFANVRELLELFGGVWITTDLVTVKAINRRKQISPGLGQISQMVSRLSDRPIGDTYFQDTEQIEDFITVQGFKCDRTPVLSLINLDQLNCLHSLNINPEIAEAILSDAYVYSLSV